MQKRKFPKMMCILGILASIVLGYYMGACFKEGKVNDIVHLMKRAERILEDPLQNYWNGKYTIYAIFAMLVVFFMVFIQYIASQKNYMFGKEQGSSMWEDVSKVNAALADHDNSHKNPKNIMIKKEYNGFLYQMSQNVIYKVNKIKQNLQKGEANE